MRPADGCSSPTATFSSVDLPQPVGPTTDTNSPGAMRSVLAVLQIRGDVPSGTILSTTARVQDVAG